ncbi:helix-turn-helix domain-containing protein [Agrococcus casei]|uniref:helix-turn-helix domain-containing protein n=1 Tax=Agrococcus casei TaxID=343512 RepID=UPI003F928EF7
MNAPESDALVPRIGRAIRDRRKASGLTLTQLAQQAEISVSHLSNIETGQSIASLPLLSKVASALGISMAELTRDENRLVAHSGRLPTPGEHWRILSHDDLETRIAAGDFAAGAELAFPFPLEGRDCFLTVLSGAVKVTVDGGEYSLGQGDAIDARSAAILTIVVADDARVVCSTSPSSRDTGISG